MYAPRSAILTLILSRKQTALVAWGSQPSRKCVPVFVSWRMGAPRTRLTTSIDWVRRLCSPVFENSVELSLRDLVQSTCEPRLLTICDASSRRMHKGVSLAWLEASTVCYGSGTSAQQHGQGSFKTRKKVKVFKLRQHVLTTCGSGISFQAVLEG